MDVGQHAAVRYGDPRQQPAELLVVADGEEEVARDDAVPLVVARRVAGELEHLGGEVLQHGGEVDGGARAHARRVPPLLEVPPDAADGELQPRLDGPRHRRLLRPAQLPPRRRFLRLAAVHAACFRSGFDFGFGFVCELGMDLGAAFIYAVAPRGFGGCDPRDMGWLPLDGWETNGTDIKVGERSVGRGSGPISSKRDNVPS
jgi:hypothetical protein